MSTADQLISIFRNNTATHLSTFRSKCRDVEIKFDFSWKEFRLLLVAVSTCVSESNLFERLLKGVTMSVDAECEESLTPRDVCSSIPQAHRGFINSEP